ncbi:MAG: hypothetical protein ACOCRL_00450 [Bacillota bacterium]
MFSNVTIVEAMKLLTKHDEIDEILLKYGLQDISQRRTNTYSKQRRRNEIANYLINHPDLSGYYSDSLIYDIVEELVNKEIEEGRYYFPEKTFNNSSNLYRALRNDGYCIRNNTVCRQTPEECDLVEKENFLEDILDTYDFTTSLGHLRQAKNAYTRGDWATTNSQIRTSVESLFNDIANFLDPNNASENSYQNRILLSNYEPPVFIRDLNEWEDHGKGFFNGFWKRLCPEGPHPGLSDEEDSTFRLHLSYIVMSQLMLRVEKIENISW